MNLPVGRTAIEHTITSKGAEAASAIASDAYTEKVRLEEGSAAAAINLPKAEKAISEKINEANSKIQELQSSLREAQAKAEELS